MMYEHIVSKLREAYQDKEASKERDHFAIQFNIWGEGHGALYLEITDGKIHIEPYEYYDRNTLISTDAQTLLGIATGKIDPVTYGDLYVEGDSFGLEILRDISKIQLEDEPEEVKNKDTEKKEKAEKKEKKEKKKKTTRKKSVKDKAENAAETVKDKAGSAAEAVKDKAGSAVESVKDKVESAVESVKEKRESSVKSGRKKRKA